MLKEKNKYSYYGQINKHINFQKCEPATSMSLSRGYSSQGYDTWESSQVQQMATECIFLGAVTFTDALLWYLVQLMLYAKVYSSFSTLKMTWKKGMVGESE